MARSGRATQCEYFHQSSEKLQQENCLWQCSRIPLRRNQWKQGALVVGQCGTSNGRDTVIVVSGSRSGAQSVVLAARFGRSDRSAGALRDVVVVTPTEHSEGYL